MGQRDKLIVKILSATSDSNILFEDACNLLISFGFSVRIKGSHHIFYRQDIEEILNIQPKDGKTKPYQVRQIRNIIIRYKLGGDLDV